MVNVICWKSFSPKKQSTNDKQYVGIKQLLICCYYWFRYLFLIPNGGQIKFYSYFSRRRRREIHLQFTAQVQVYFRQNLLDKILLVKINYLWTVFFFVCVCVHYIVVVWGIGTIFSREVFPPHVNLCTFSHCTNIKLFGSNPQQTFIP